LEIDTRVDLNPQEHKSLFELNRADYRPIAEILNHLNFDVPLLKFMQQQYKEYDLLPKKRAFFHI
jgi:hypothetical protein